MMSILGFSHISTEAADIQQSRSFYEKLGFDLSYAFEENVPDLKQAILYGNPSSTKLMYQKHPARASIGIELIAHSTHGQQGGVPGIAYGWTNNDGKKNIYIDPDGNSLVSFFAPGVKCSQHIFIPVTSLEESKVFYKDKFRFQELSLDGFPREIYKDLYKDVLNTAVLNTAVLGLPSCLSDNWNACLHLVEVPFESRRRFLNDCHFSCFCLLVDKAEYFSFIDQNLQITGPIEMAKIVQGKKSVFTIGFIKAPDGFFVEFYVPGRL